MALLLTGSLHPESYSVGEPLWKAVDFHPTVLLTAGESVLPSIHVAILRASDTLADIVLVAHKADTYDPSIEVQHQTNFQYKSFWLRYAE